MAGSQLIYVGIKGSVLALDAATGVQVWVAKLAGYDFVNVAMLHDDVLATTKGEIFCLEAKTGTLRWRNPLKGFGLGLVTIAADGLQGSALAPQAEQCRRDDAAAASTGGASAS